MSGFIGGMVTGTIVVLGVAVAASLSLPLPPKPDVSAETPAPVASQTVPETTETPTSKGDADLVELAPRAPDDPETGTEAASEDTDTAPAGKPEVTAATTQPAQPETVYTTDQTLPDVSAELDPSPTTEAPAQPGQAGGGSSAADSSQAPTVPEVSQDAPARVGQAPADPAPAPAADPDGTGTAETAQAGDAPAKPALDTSEDTESAPETSEKTEPAPETAEDTDPEPKLAGLPQIGGEDAGAETGPGVGRPVVPLTERNRTEEPQADTPEAPPVQAYSTPFENPDEKPLMSIILIDAPGAQGAEALADFPYPLTIALDPTDPEATAKMERHRAAGFEVVALADLPTAATAQDAEVSLSVWLDTLPQTVAVLEGTGTGIQGNRALSDQVTAIAGGTGRGLITLDSGLNTVQKLAARNGVPSAVVFRDFDGADQASPVMRRFLDQAAFRAGQEGSVIMLGRVRPDTVSALLLWGLQDRASRVALAPVTAVLSSGEVAQ